MQGHKYGYLYDTSMTTGNVPPLCAPQRAEYLMPPCFIWSGQHWFC